MRSLRQAAVVFVAAFLLAVVASGAFVAGGAAPGVAHAAPAAPRVHAHALTSLDSGLHEEPTYPYCAVYSANTIVSPPTVSWNGSGQCFTESDTVSYTMTVEVDLYYCPSNQNGFCSGAWHFLYDSVCSSQTTLTLSCSGSTTCNTGYWYKSATKVSIIANDADSGADPSSATGPYSNSQRC